MATMFIEFGAIDLSVLYITSEGYVRFYSPLSMVLDERGHPVHQVKQSTAFYENIVLISQSDGATPVTGVASGSVTLEYKKESDSTWTSAPTATTETWDEIGSGMYRVTWASGFADELGIFAVRCADPSVTGWFPFFGETQVLSATRADIQAGLNTITGQNVAIQAGVNTATGQNTLLQTDVDSLQVGMSVVTGQTAVRSHSDIYNAVTGLPASATNLPVVQVGASYDGTTLGISLGLEREGQAVTSPVSGAYILYDASGSNVASGDSSSPDAQGVFTFSKALTLTDDTVIYLHGQVTDGTGTAITRQFLPVVG